jgi:F-type H+-transporting ATPase subunit b
MEATLHQLGDILLKALPTFLLVILLTFYLKAVFFRPLHNVLEKRYQATEGARIAAQKSLDRAAQKTAEYEAAMRAARAEVYQSHDQLHRDLQERESQQVAAARQSAEAAIEDAKKNLAGDVAAAKATLQRDSDLLADEIAESILKRSAA